MQILHDGRLLWTSPTGTQHLSEPDDYRNHLPEADLDGNDQIEPAA